MINVENMNFNIITDELSSFHIIQQQQTGCDVIIFVPRMNDEAVGLSCVAFVIHIPVRFWSIF